MMLTLAVPQNRQYAVTIVTMENKLHSMSSRCNDMELELNDSLSKLEGRRLNTAPPFLCGRWRDLCTLFLDNTT